MKHLKKYEIYIDSSNVEEEYDLVKHLKYKIGDYVRLSDSAFDDILEIIAINTEDDYQPYQIKDGTGKYWNSGRYFIRPNKEELEKFLMKKDVNKYNL